MSKEKTTKPKMTKDTIPENFTLSLAIVDALPVLFFGGSMILIGLLFGSPMFLIGAALCFWAGAAKVLWKIIVVTKKKNVWWMFLQMRIVMPIGFVLMILAVILNRNAINLSAVLAAVVSLPSVLFFAIGDGRYCAKVNEFFQIFFRCLICFVCGDNHRF